MGQGAKYGVRLWPVLQDVGQLATLYGPHGASTFIGNSGGVFAFTPGEDETAEFLSKHARTHWVPEPSASDDPHGGGCRISYSMREQRVWPPDKIRSIPKFCGLVWYFGQSKPQPVYCLPWFEDPKCLATAWRPDPYHRIAPASPAASPSTARPGRKVTAAIAALVAVVIAGAVLFNATGVAHSTWSPAVSPSPGVDNHLHQKVGVGTVASWGGLTVAVAIYRLLPKASDISSPPCLLRLLPAGAIAGWALHPLEKRRLVTAHVESRPSPKPR
jgi:hypothetical protein